VRRQLCQKGGLPRRVGRAAAVAPEHDGELGAGGDGLGRVEGVAAEFVGRVVTL
jgi:hypothetical protein